MKSPVIVKSSLRKEKQSLRPLSAGRGPGSAHIKYSSIFYLFFLHYKHILVKITFGVAIPQSHKILHFPRLQRDETPSSSTMYFRFFVVYFLLRFFVVFILIYLSEQLLSIKYYSAATTEVPALTAPHAGGGTRSSSPISVICILKQSAII